ncbi:hypothetical protein JCM6882_001892 [Rhodosporidiobolus microsporus]
MSEFNALPSSTDYLSTSPDRTGDLLLQRGNIAGEAFAGGNKVAAVPNLSPASTASSSLSSSSSSAAPPPSDLKRPLVCMLDGRQLNLTAKEWEEWEAGEQSM